MIKRVFLVFFVCILLFSLVLAAYGDTVVDNDSDEEVAQEDENEDEEKVVKSVVSKKSEGKSAYTTNFYIALGLGVFAALLVLYILFIFLRGPTEKWGPRVDKSAFVDNSQKHKFGLPMKRKVSVTNVVGQQN